MMFGYGSTGSQAQDRHSPVSVFQADFARAAAPCHPARLHGPRLRLWARRGRQPASEKRSPSRRLGPIVSPLTVGTGRRSQSRLRVERCRNSCRAVRNPTQSVYARASHACRGCSCRSISGQGHPIPGWCYHQPRGIPEDLYAVIIPTIHRRYPLHSAARSRPRCGLRLQGARRGRKICC